MSADRLFFYPYSMKSSACRAIARRMGGRLIKRTNSAYRRRPSDVVVNWGCSYVPSSITVTLNHPVEVGCAVNKIRTLEVLQQAGVAIPEWHRSREIAKRWHEEGALVYARTKLSSSRGRGIVLVRPDKPWGPQLEDALATGDIPLFTKQVKNSREFRVYVVGDNVTTVLEKRKRRGTQPNEHIRSHGDWVFALGLREPIQQDFRDECIKAVKALGLDFAGLDVVISEESGRATILEVNSAPGVDAPTSQTQFIEGLQQLIANRA